MKPLYPYDVFRERGLNPRSTAREVKNFIPTDRSEGAAWRSIQTVRSRMRTDFFLYIVQDEEGLRSLLQRLRESSAPSDLSAFTSQLGDDTPVLLISLGRRDEARRWLEEAQARDVLNGRWAHLLTLMYLAEAQQYEEAGRDAAALDAWRAAVLHWVSTLANDAYWDSWCAERERCYDDHSHEFSRIGFKTAVRDDLYRFMRAELLHSLDTQSRKGASENYRLYAEMLLLYDIEWWGAESLRFAGGVEVGGRRLSCGPMTIAHLGLRREFGKTIQNLQSDQDRFDTLTLSEALRPHKEPRVPSDVVRRLRLFFSRLAPAAAALNYNKPEQALEHLAGLRAGGDGDGDLVYGQLNEGTARFVKDSMELSVQANLSAANNAITSVPMNWEAAGAAWRRAAEDAQSSGVSTLVARSVAEHALMRARAIKEESERDMMVRLAEVAGMLEQAHPLANDADKGEIEDELVEALTYQSQCYREGGQVGTALDSVEKARGLAPDNPEVVAEFAACLIRRALELGEGTEALGLLERAKGLAGDTLTNYPGHAGLLRVSEQAQAELLSLQGMDPFDDSLDDLFKSLKNYRVPAGLAEARESIKRAEAAREVGDYAEAEEEIKQALALNPGNAWAKAEAVQIYVAWGGALLAQGAADEARRKTHLGLAHDAGNVQLRELMERIDGAASGQEARRYV